MPAATLHHSHTGQARVSLIWPTFVPVQATDWSEAVMQDRVDMLCEPTIREQGPDAFLKANAVGPQKARSFELHGSDCFATRDRPERLRRAPPL